MSRAGKRVRIATNVNVPEGCYEYIEQDANGTLYWTAGDSTIYPNVNVGASFPVDLKTVEDFFSKIGRSFDASRLPPGTITHPYG